MDESLVTGGPAWLDSARFDITAKTAPTSKQKLRLMTQELLSQRFHLVVHHTSKTEPILALTVAKEGAKLQRAAGSEKLQKVDMSEGQVHLNLSAFTMADLAELLPDAAPAYVTLPVENLTNLEGAYDFKLDWMPNAPTTRRPRVPWRCPYSTQYRSSVCRSKSARFRRMGSSLKRRSDLRREAPPRLPR